MTRPLVSVVALSLVLAGAGASCRTPREAEASVASSIEDPALRRIQREVWDVWHAGDTARFRQITPGLIAVDSEDESFSDQEKALRSSAEFHAGGGRLLELSFPEMRVQRFGEVAIVYSTYRSVLLIGGDTLRRNGHATEVFVRQDGEWIHTGWHLDSGK